MSSLSEPTTGEKYIKLITASGKVVVRFSMVTCGPCKLYEPVFESLEDMYPNVSFFKVDMDVYPELWDILNIDQVPTVQFWRAGQQLKEMTIVGYYKSKLEAAVKKLDSV